MASSAENTLHSPQGDETVKEYLGVNNELNIRGYLDYKQTPLPLPFTVQNGGLKHQSFIHSSH